MKTTVYGGSGSYNCAVCDHEFEASVVLEGGDASVGVPDGGYVEDCALEVNDAGDLVCVCGATLLIADLVELEREECAERRAEAMADARDDW